MATIMMIVMIGLLLLGFPMMIPLTTAAVIGFVMMFDGFGQMGTFIQQMMGHGSSFVVSGLGCTDIHLAIHLHRIGADAFAVQPPRQLDRQSGFASCGRAENHNDGALVSRHQMGRRMLA